MSRTVPPTAGIPETGSDPPAVLVPQGAFPEPDYRDEVVIAAPPARRSGTIRVELSRTGRSRPIPADDPRAGRD